MAELITAGSTLKCPHGGDVIGTPTSAVTISGEVILRADDSFHIANCPFSIPNGPHPCVRVEWMDPAHNSIARGSATLTSASLGLCVAADEARQGTVMVLSTQAIVSGR